MLRFVVALSIVSAACSDEQPGESLLSSSRAEMTSPADCVFDASDRFEPRARLEKGPRSGECLDTRVGRPVRRLSEQEAKNFGGSASDTITVANVSHRGEYYVAHIPYKKIKSGIFQLEYFPAIVPAGHTQLRLQFEENAPVTLVSQASKDMTKVVKVNDLILSVEAIGDPGYKYDLFKGMEDHFAAVHRITTLQDKYQHMVVRQKHRVEQWKLNLTPSELAKILQQYVQKSESAGTSTMYHTLFFNCTTEIVAAIDAGAQYNLLEKFGKFTAKTTDFYPNVIRISLQKRGLLPKFGRGNDLPELDADTSFEH